MIRFPDSQTDAGEKKRILAEEYGMIMTTELEGRIQTMCNLSENIREQGIEAGIRQGIEKGIEQGIEQGRILSITEFLSNGGDENLARRLLKATDDEIRRAKELLENP